MSTDQNKAIVRRFIDEVLNKHNLAHIDEYVSPNGVDHLLLPGMPQGPEGARQFVGMYMAAFPDLRATIEDMIAEGDKVVTRITYHGTNTGPLMGMPATGKSATITGIDITHIADGKSVEHWAQLDLLGMMQLSRPEYERAASLEGAYFVGSPQQVIDKLLYEHQLFGHQRFLAQVDIGGLPFDKVAQTIELLATRVAPVVRREIAAREAAPLA